MNIDPILQAPIAIQIHVASILPAAILGPFLFVARKGTPRHRLLGKAWLGLMVIAALSSFFIHAIDVFAGFSPIHLLSVFVLYASWQAIRAARMHRIAAHRWNVISMYVGGVIIAGGFTFLPGRIMHDVAFTYGQGWPSGPALARFLLAMAICLLLVLLPALASRGKTSVRGAAGGKIG